MTLDELDASFEKMINEFPDKRRELVESCGDKMYEKVVANIEANVKEDTGNLKAGVGKHIGSRGGYAAVRPNWKKAPHTDLVENGHKLVRAGEVVGWVPGKHMYRNALNEVANELRHDAEKMAKEMVGGFSG